MRRNKERRARKAGKREAARRGRQGDVDAGGEEERPVGLLERERVGKEALKGMLNKMNTAMDIDVGMNVMTKTGMTEGNLIRERS